MSNVLLRNKKEKSDVDLIIFDKIQQDKCVRSILERDNTNILKDIINFAEKYISKTIYKTFSKKKIEKELGINLNSLQANDVLI